MRIEWVEDLLAVLETSSLNEAAARRFVTQPAFSRRLQTIEERLGVSLIDRSCKPARPVAALARLHERLRELARSTKDLQHDLRRRSFPEENVTIACQHAIAATIAPGIVKRVGALVSGGVLLKSANLDECTAMLLLKQVQLTLTYRSCKDRHESGRTVHERLTLGIEYLIPVISREALSMLEAAREIGELPIVGYPNDVFLGRVLEREVMPNIAGFPAIRRKAETALTLAALQMAHMGVGVAWVPTSIALKDLNSRDLVDLSDELPHCELEIMATRLIHTYTAGEMAAWAALSDA